MLTGELEAENLETNLFGYVLFLLFVLFVPICLLNLMTGLAVSDIAAIREEAEIDLIAAKVELYANIESVLLGRAVKGLKCNPLLCCLNSGCNLQRKINILNHSLRDCKLTWFLDIDNKMEPDASEVNWFSKFVPNTLKKFRKMEWLVILEEAQKIANKCNLKEENTEDDLNQKVDSLQVQIAQLTEIVKQLQVHKEEENL